MGPVRFLLVAAQPAPSASKPGVEGSGIDDVVVPPTWILAPGTS
jgi:hypothetical protein